MPEPTNALPVGLGRYHHLRGAWMNWRYTEEAETLVRALYLNHNWSPDDIRLFFGCSSATIYVWLRKLNIARTASESASLKMARGKNLTQPNHKRTERFNAQVRDLYERLGLNYSEISRRLSCHQSTVALAAERGGWHETEKAVVSGKLAHPWTVREERRASLLASRHGYKETARRLGCTIYELVWVVWSNGAGLSDEPEYAARRTLITCQRLQQAVDLVLAGGNYKEACLSIPGLHHDRLVAALQEAGSHRTRQELSRHQRTDIRDKWICERYIAGYSGCEISAELSWAPTFVYNVLHDYGIDIRGCGRGKLLRAFREGRVTVENWWTYSRVVRAITGSNYRQWRSYIDPEGLRGDEVHLDHRLSITDGFCNGVPPEIVAHPANLALVRAQDNLIKGSKSTITLPRLKAAIRQFNTQHRRRDVRSNTPTFLSLAPRRQTVAMGASGGNL